MDNKKIGIRIKPISCICVCRKINVWMQNILNFLALIFNVLNINKKREQKLKFIFYLYLLRKEERISMYMHIFLNLILQMLFFT